MDAYGHTCQRFDVVIESDATRAAVVGLLYVAALAGLWFGWVRAFSRPFGYCVMAAIAAVMAAWELTVYQAPRWAAVVTVLLVVLFIGEMLLLVVGGGIRILAGAGLRYHLRKTARTEVDEARGDGPAPPELEELAAAFEARGFIRLFVGRTGRAAPIVLLRDDGVIAEVVTSPDLPPTMPRTVTELTSILLGRRGLLCTGTSGVRLVGWAGELRQVFPGSRPEHLIDLHDDALRFLRARAITADPVARDQVIEAETWGRRIVVATTARASSRELRERARDMTTGVHRHVGALASDSAVDDRLAAFWDAVHQPGASGAVDSRG
jgi:hypothetical protein